MLQELAGPLAGTGEPSGTLARGVDVAAAQHPGGAGIDWPQVAAAGYSFAAVKATEGTYYANPWYAADTAGAAAAGLQVIGYHVAIPNVSSGAAQADYAVHHLGQAAGGQAAGGRSRPLELDVEYDPYAAADHTNQCYGLSAVRLVAWIGAFTREAERVTGQAPVIYTSAAWWRACTGDSSAFSADPLWLAGYGTAGVYRAGRVGVLVLLAVHQRWHGARHRGQRRDRRQPCRPEPDGRGHSRRGGWGGRGFWGGWWGCCGVWRIGGLGRAGRFGGLRGFRGADGGPGPGRGRLPRRVRAGVPGRPGGQATRQRIAQPGVPVRSLAGALTCPHGAPIRTPLASSVSLQEDRWRLWCCWLRPGGRARGRWARDGRCGRSAGTSRSRCGSWR